MKPGIQFCVDKQVFFFILSYSTTQESIESLRIKQVLTVCQRYQHNNESLYVLNQETYILLFPQPSLSVLCSHIAAAESASLE